MGGVPGNEGLEAPPFQRPVTGPVSPAPAGNPTLAITAAYTNVGQNTDTEESIPQKILALSVMSCVPREASRRVLQMGTNSGCHTIKSRDSPSPGEDRGRPESHTPRPRTSSGSRPAPALPAVSLPTRSMRRAVGGARPCRRRTHTHAARRSHPARSGALHPPGRVSCHGAHLAPARTCTELDRERHAQAVRHALHARTHGVRDGVERGGAHLKQELVVDLQVGAAGSVQPFTRQAPLQRHHRRLDHVGGAALQSWVGGRGRGVLGGEGGEGLCMLQTRRAA